MDAYRQKGIKIQQYFPALAEKILTAAHYAYRGQLVLPGTMGERHFVGDPVEWLDNPFDNKEYVYHLNRMGHLKVMAEAYAMTGKETYAEKVISELENWINTVPVPEIDESNLEAFKECSPWRALEVGSRGGDSWPVIVSCLADSPHYTRSFSSKFRESARIHMQILARISPRLWPKADHNHYLIENIGLLSLSLLFPELDRDESCRHQAERELDRCLHNQCTPEGGQVEGSPSYHNACLHWFALRGILTKQNGNAVCPEYLGQLDKMFSHSVQSTRNCGGCFPLGDSHGEDKETLALPALALYLLNGDYHYLATALRFASKEALDEELCKDIFRFDDIEKLSADYAKALTCDIKPNLPLLSFQKTLGEAFIRTGWKKEDISLAVICKSPVQNMHSHIDPGSIDLTAFGKPLIVDPGIYTYKEGIDRYRFKSTLWHSTVTINHKDAWEYLGSWKYGPQQESRLEAAYVTPSYSIVRMNINNYAPVHIIRTILLVEKQFVLVLDDLSSLSGCHSDNSVAVSGDPTDRKAELSGDLVEISFNVNSTAFSIGENHAYTTDEGANILLRSSGATILREPAQYSPKVDFRRNSTMIRFKNIPKTTSFLHATSLVPFLHDAVPLTDLSVERQDFDTYRIHADIQDDHYAFSYRGGEIHAANPQL